MEKEPKSVYTVRFGDCDPFGHLNNSRYLDYLLNAREDHLKEHYGMDLKEWAARGVGFVVNRHEIRYLRPVGYNDRICIQTALIAWGDTWLQVEMLMWNEEMRQLKAALWTTFTRINTATGAKEALPADLLDWIVKARREGTDLAKGLDGRIAELR